MMAWRNLCDGEYSGGAGRKLISLKRERVSSARYKVHRKRLTQPLHSASLAEESSCREITVLSLERERLILEDNNPRGKSVM